MKFSTRAEYGLRAIAHLDKKRKQAVSLAQIAKDERLSLPYLERLFAVLKKDGIVTADKGAKGGYFLSRPPKDISVLEVITALEGSLAPYDCAGKISSCKICGCRISPVWDKLYVQIVKTLKNIKLSTIIK